VTGLYYAIIFVLLNEASLFNEQFAEILFVRMTICEFVAVFQAFIMLLFVMLRHEETLFIEQFAEILPSE
jgi:hypothetical protein